ncbi:MAG: hypothetical protein ABIT08_17425 [Bacteroidia bacterium]
MKKIERVRFYKNFIKTEGGKTASCQRTAASCQRDTAACKRDTAASKDKKATNQRAAAA